MALPDAFWLIKVSVVKLFTANKAKIGERVVDPNAKYPTKLKLFGLNLATLKKQV